MSHNIMNIVDFVEKLENEINIPCYRHINIDYVDGKKIPLGEKNDMTTEQINKNRGKGDWISIYLKHIPNLYVIDFDEKVSSSGTVIVLPSVKLLHPSICKVSFLLAISSIILQMFA